MGQGLRHAYADCKSVMRVGRGGVGFQWPRPKKRPYIPPSTRYIKFTGEKSYEPERTYPKITAAGTRSLC
nr:MAG TPA: hypothetical protein [Caudoviricetes sp.]